MKGVVIFLADGFEDMEALGTRDVLIRGGIELGRNVEKDAVRTSGRQNRKRETGRGDARAMRKDRESGRGESSVQSTGGIREIAGAKKRLRFKCRACNNHFT